MFPIELAGWTALAPPLLLAATALVLFLVDSISPRSSSRSLLAGTTVAGSLVSLAVAVWFTAAGVGTPGMDGGRGVITLFDGQFVVDGMALFFMIVVAIVTALVAVASYDYMDGHAYQAEYYSLMVLAATGMSLMAAANSLVTIFIALELASLPSYALVSILKDNRGSVEAGLKYFLIGALSSAIFVYGISLVYGVTGHLQLDLIAEEIVVLAGEGAGYGGLLGLGILLLIGGFAFKTASVPFHFWAPEAYEGAPAPISAFLSSASKAAGFVIAFRVFTTAFPLEPTAALIGVDWTVAFVILAIVTMTVGNFAAATQDKVKRMLAYSSIGHAGYALIGLAGLTADGGELVMGAAMMHLLVYGFMNTGAFLFVALAEHWGVGRTFEDYNGLGQRAPVACVALAIFMFSLAGIPPLGGFWSKYFLFTGAISVGSAAMLAVAAALVVNSALSLYYYSRLVKAVWIEEPIVERDALAQPTGLYAAIVFAAVMTVVLLPGFGPVVETAIDAAAYVI
ncbi:NADH-quinone oxidoreductase subunit N [Natronobacterium gregoryi]|uniref:Oxidoreductase n=2 Tax=Natronobacterium gregoryi TaxID=44930 RepID=L0AG37_NATGS|nr:NADH-quinone oxidoreductase subunit N [Natronobacterium gregoryi]AFZ72097.1 proton-translocating NADH-quinone oxidoreductase, chain N [Natronobacterium gregoryi SP2]ELY62872.1 NAD(P)H-quinone oxidoreductase subunit 2 [Natronobacterium gregoryi SP2]PLK20071.1 oxidoreductase [Natronobacterium gregoryi SP2]SFJ58139.1 NADH-quinone oxidoreductase subunit N [Natronobacterium gregoryi]